MNLSRVIKKPMEDEMRKKTIKTETKMKDLHLPAYREIPGVGLYLDQTSEYINDCLKDLDECAITNSMIANYVKKDLIDNPVKKRYYRDQIACLIFIVMTKSVLSLDDVAVLFRLQKEKYSCEEAYVCFRDFFEKLSEGEDVVLKKDEKEEKVLLRDITMTIVTNLSLHRRLKEIGGK